MQQQQVQVNLAEVLGNSTAIKCECGSAIFKQRTMLRKISSLFSPSGKEEIFPVVVHICTHCNTVKPDPIFDLFKDVDELFITEDNG